MALTIRKIEKAIKEDRFKEFQRKQIEDRNYKNIDFIEDLKKVCQPVKKSDKQKPSSDKT